MEFVESIPPNFKIKGKTQKYILKKAISKWIPNHTIRRRKIGFNTPVDDWFRGKWQKSTEDRLLDSGSACNEFFKRKTIQTMMRDHKSGRQDHKRALFCLLTFEIWHEQFIRSKTWKKGST